MPLALHLKAIWRSSWCLLPEVNEGLRFMAVSTSSQALWSNLFSTGVRLFFFYPFTPRTYARVRKEPRWNIFSVERPEMRGEKTLHKNCKQIYHEHIYYLFTPLLLTKICRNFLGKIPLTPLNREILNTPENPRKQESLDLNLPRPFFDFFWLFLKFKNFFFFFSFFAFFSTFIFLARDFLVTLAKS